MSAPSGTPPNETLREPSSALPSAGHVPKPAGEGATGRAQADGTALPAPPAMCRRVHGREWVAHRRAPGTLSYDATSCDLRVALTELDEPLLAVLANGDIRLLRSEWLLEQPDGFILPRRQELEELEK